MKPNISLIESISQDNSHELRDLGTSIGKLFTDHGLPLDMSLDQMKDYTHAEKLSVLFGACQWFIQHKRLSGASDKALDRQRKANRDMIDRFTTRQEVGMY